MSTKRNVAADRRRRRLITLGWSFLLLLAMVLLIAFEKTAILYILATLGVAALLLIVAFADLAHTDAAPQESSAKREA
ncbi:MAG TPA: hypothetical protein VF251_09235 [Pyrinomonadaceae bacterium]